MTLRARLRYVSNIAVYYLTVAATFSVFFELWRLLTLLQLRERASAVPFGIIAQSFLVGLRFDFAIACYISLPLTLLGMLPFIDISRSSVLRRFNNAILFLSAGAAFFICVADIEFFKFFNTRLNGMALEWSDTPAFVITMIWQSYPVVRYLLLFAIVFLVFIKIVLFLQKRIVLAVPSNSVWLNLVWLLPVGAIMLLGMRGRIEEKAPLTWGNAYFSEHAFANLLALNPNFTFVRDAFYDSRSKAEAERTIGMIRRAGAEAATRRLLSITVPSDAEQGGRIHRRVEFTSENPSPPNVILIIMESFGSHGIGCLRPSFPYDLSPWFDSLASEGLLFTNIYSTGIHTHTGIVGTLYGYPALPGKSPLKEAAGENRFWGLPSILRDQGYQTLFFCTHDPHFDNMQGFLMSNGMMKVYSLFDYDGATKLSTLGVPDHVMFDYAFDLLSHQSGSPFFAALLTASNHGPWLVPDVPFARVPDSEQLRAQLNAFKYSDWALGQFIRKIQSDPKLSNTIIVVTSDHGTLVNPTTDLDLSHFEIPLLILDTDKRLPQGQRVNRLGSQTDILPTVMGLLRLDYDDYSFGKNLLDTATSPLLVTDFALISAGNRVGYLEEDYYLITRIGGSRSLYDLVTKSGDLRDSLPAIADDYEAKALSLFQTAYLNLKLPADK